MRPCMSFSRVAKNVFIRGIINVFPDAQKFQRKVPQFYFCELHTGQTKNCWTEGCTSSLEKCEFLTTFRSPIILCQTNVESVPKLALLCWVPEDPIPLHFSSLWIRDTAINTSLLAFGALTPGYHITLMIIFYYQVEFSKLHVIKTFYNFEQTQEKR